jgi:type III pantothenate kinase
VSPSTEFTLSGAEGLSAAGLLVVDIGNTTTKVGTWNGARIETVSVSPTGEQESRDSSFEIGPSTLDSRLSTLDLPVAICSVVPEAEAAWLDWCEREGKPAFVVRGDTPSPLLNRYRAPARLGPDRLATAVAAAHRFGAPVIVASLGTAVVVDAVSASKEYLGGAIWVGVTPGLDVLFQRAALLPHISQHPPSSPIGSDTETCLLAGAFHGTAALIEGVAERMREFIGEGARLILTGGDADLISCYLKAKHEVAPFLTLEGIALIWEHSRSGCADANR